MSKKAGLQLDKVRQFIQEQKLTVQQFEEQAGWEIELALENADVAQEWNIDCLRDVCQQLNVNWLDVFPIGTRV